MQLMSSFKSHIRNILPMKRFVISLIFLSIAISIKAQLSGNGTFSSPYKGTLNQNMTWSSDVYIGGDILIYSFQLNINPGVKVIFLVDSADLIIKGSGSLVADATASNKIRFTADDDGDGNFGESGERWGHISFESSSGNSVIDNAILEFGFKSGANTEGYGGGIHINTNNVIITSCIFQNNYASWGGGIFINKYINSSVLNCYFLNNQSQHAGGGAYLWTGCNSSFINCIFEGNHSNEPTYVNYAGGGLATGQSCLGKVVNCTFINNTCSRIEGQAISLDRSPGFLVVNSIFWGLSEKQVYCHSISSASSFIDCAYRGITYTYGTPIKPVILSATNDATDGPNFYDPSGSDWRIVFISPCRDAGANSWSGVNVPSTDYNGNSRIQTKDIGCFECQYSNWIGVTNTLWNTASNWEGNIDPSVGTGDVIVPAVLTNYPISSSNPDFVIESGKQMILKPGAKVTLGTLTNNGLLKLEADASGISSLLINSFSGNNAVVELYLTGGGTKTTYKWHYISTPVSSLPVSTFTTVTPDIVRYYDDRVTTDMVQGWVAQDGWIYAAGSFGGPTFTSLLPGLGYDYYDSNNNRFSFSGQLNTDDVTVSLNHAGGINNGYNLLGNPFSCGLDWDYIISNGYPSYASKSLYFTRDNTLCSYISGVGSPSDVNGIIPPMQGFFIRTGISGNLTLAEAAKTQTNIHERYKKGSEIIPLVRLSLKDDTLSDETVIRFDSKASTGLDNDYDALKIFYSSKNTAIYSFSEGSRYVINGQPFPDTTVSIPVGVNILVSGIHTISTTQLQGLDAYGVYLKDNFTGFTSDLKTNPVVTFTASAGSLPDRFILKVTNYTTGIPETNISNALFNIYHGLGFVNILPLADDWDANPGLVTIFDMTGRKVHELRNAEFVKNSIISLQSPVSKGIYIVEIKSGVKRYTGKVVIK